ncbi:MAG: response regulator [Anaerolineae bacterium]|nr:response regulator [Anaerolineae bacterium]
MPSVPRIVTVDPTYSITRIVRGAMTLLNRQYILIEVPSSDDALGEVSNSSIDLVVTAQDVPGIMDGVELATRISHESLGTPVIVLAESGNSPVDEATLTDAPFQYFMRPVAEPFLRGLRIALDGETAVEAEGQTVSAGPDLGPVPPVDIDPLRDVVIPLVRDVGAMAVILADRTGRVLIEHGATGYIDRETLAVILGPSFARATEVSELIGGKAWTMHYYDGERLDVFGLSLGLHYFICLIFDGSNRGAFGAVTMFGRRAADQMIDMLGEAAYAVKAEAPPAAKPKKKTRKTQETAAVTQAEVEEPAADIGALFDTAPDSPTLEPVTDFDPDALFGQAVDESMADNLFDPDALSDLAATLAAEEGERVGYDEAIDMGILDD